MPQRNNSNKYKVQINAREYKDLDYLDKPRWISFWHQIHEVVKTNPKSVLEIGVGNGVVANSLKMLGYKVTTVDIDREIKPDIIADIRHLPFPKNKFDTILCAQVLEHLPFADFPLALGELHRVSRKIVILTLPHDYLTYFLFTWKFIPFIKPHTFFSLIPRRERHTFNGQHFWEIGKVGYSNKKIIEMIRKQQFLVLKNYCLPENPNHHFFVLKKSKS